MTPFSRGFAPSPLLFCNCAKRTNSYAGIYIRVWLNIFFKIKRQGVHDQGSNNSLVYFTERILAIPLALVYVFTGHLIAKTASICVRKGSWTITVGSFGVENSRREVISWSVAPRSYVTSVRVGRSGYEVKQPGRQGWCQALVKRGCNYRMVPLSTNTFYQLTLTGIMKENLI